MNWGALAADALGHVMGGGKYFDQRFDGGRVFAAMHDNLIHVVLWAPNWPMGIWVSWKKSVTPGHIAEWLRLQAKGQNLADTSEKLELYGTRLVEQMLAETAQ